MVGDEAERLAERGILLLRAPNAGPLTLSGTNTWVVGRDPAWVVDPGPDLDDHVRAIIAALDARGGLGGVVITHNHEDHRGALAALLALRPAPVAAGREADVTLRDGLRVGPFEAVATPGHAPEHFALIAGGACFTGDAVLGDGSVLVSPGPGSLRSYLDALDRLRARPLAVICPGHGPPVWNPDRKLDEYIEHRRAREATLTAALERGLREPDDLLAAAWPEVPEHLRPAAAVMLVAHLEKLAEESRLPPDVAWPSPPGAGLSGAEPQTKPG